MLNGYSVGSTRTLADVWQASRKMYRFYVDGAFLMERSGRPDRAFRVEVLTASVGENTPNDGSNARCVFGAVTVTSGTGSVKI
jgi:hypothetical protein